MSTDKEYMRLYMKKYRQENKDKIKQVMKRYVEKHRERLTEYNRNYAKMKYDTDDEYKQYMIEKGRTIYHLSKEPYIAECKRLMKILK
jgi:TRAP-type C4-dicarboxylate transport system substrate-binding protein